MRKQPHQHRGWTFGTWLMIMLTIAVLAAVLTILPKLTQNGNVTSALVDTVEQWANSTAAPESTRKIAFATATPIAAPTSAVTRAPAVPQSGTVTLTFGGTVAVETAVRQSGYYSDSKKYDFTDILLSARDSLRGDLSLVSLENLVVPDAKMTKLIAPAAIMTMLQRAGISHVALGFGRCFEQGLTGTVSTLEAAQDARLSPVGLYADEASAAVTAQLIQISGLKIALLHGTSNLTSASSKALKKAGLSGLVPGTDDLAQRIHAARAAGAQFVVVSLHWGTEGKTASTKAQRTLAQQLADAGADVIIGNGSRRVQTAEWLFSKNADGSTHQTLCCYCLGCMLSDSRESGAISSAVVQVPVSYDAAGHVAMGQPSYTPMYLWLYKQDSVSHYRLIRANQSAPDGMEQKQAQAMQAALKNIQKVLDGGALIQGD